MKKLPVTRAWYNIWVAMFLKMTISISKISKIHFINNLLFFLCFFFSEARGFIPLKETLKKYTKMSIANVKLEPPNPFTPSTESCLNRILVEMYCISKETRIVLLNDQNLFYLNDDVFGDEFDIEDVDDESIDSDNSIIEDFTDEESSDERSVVNLDEKEGDEWDQDMQDLKVN